MTDLTEQWKKGELTDGEYYVRTIDGIVLIDCYADYWDFIQDEQVEKILCEVPSYEEWQTEKRFAKDCFTREQEKEKEYLFAVQKIAQLKDLLKEWLLFAEEENPKDFTVMSERMQDLEKQTKELIREKNK